MTTKPFPESLRDTTGAGPDFPGSSGDRERGKFRPSATPRLTTVAIASDDGSPVAKTTDELLGELLLWQKAGVIATMLQAAGARFSITDVLAEASKF